MGVYVSVISLFWTFCEALIVQIIGDKSLIESFNNLWFY